MDATPTTPVAPPKPEPWREVLAELLRLAEVAVQNQGHAYGLREAMARARELLR